MPYIREGIRYTSGVLLKSPASTTGIPPHFSESAFAFSNSLWTWENEQKLEQLKEENQNL